MRRSHLLTAAAALACALAPVAVYTAGAASEPGEAPAAAPGPAAAPPAAPPAPGARKVIVDADMGELNDDAATLFMLAKDRGVHVLGVTTVSGNTWVEAGTAYSLRQLELIGRGDVPVVPGAGEPLFAWRQSRLPGQDALYGKSPYGGAFDTKRPPSYLKLPKPPYGGYPKARPGNGAAADFIVDQVRRHPGQVTVFAIGPATNLALAVRTHPEIVPMIKEVVYMGGAFDEPGNTTPAAEFNWWFDPESAKIALRTPFRKQTIVPNEAAMKVLYTKARYDRIVAGPQTPIKKMFKDLHGPEFARNPRYTTPVWDSLTAAVFLDPGVIKRAEERYVDVDATEGPNYGRAMGYGTREFAAPRNPAGTRRATIVFEVDQERFWNLYVDRMTR
ncbi:nucleoside hydrolase [Actinomadura kijaniata]|uniref:nucleoside hydrolase n=1 Tax=Actinomadura kijaniata TaxID=46161 RepID=UPI000A03A85F|nr:nucleoside hydrolase [Actinomadura kijaniata]